MRAFVAIELSERCNRALQEAVEQLSAAVAGVRWVRPGGYHLTLKFIGDLPEKDLPAAIGALQEAAAGAEPFVMRVGGLSAFPPKGSPRVIHVLVREETGALAALQQGVEEGLLAGLGLSPEARKFTPHVTLGRAKRRFRCPPVAEMAGELSTEQFGETPADEMVLMKSDLTPKGAIYSVVERFPLGQ